MKVKVYENRQVILETTDAGTQYENLATTLKFEFPEYVEKNGEQIATENLNKYIVFNIDQNENTDLIIDDKYVIPYTITKLGKITAFLQLKEHTDNEDMTDKLIWISDGFLLTFDKSIESNIEITNEKIDAFNTLYTELNLKIIEVDNLKQYIEQFKEDVEAGKYDGKDGQDGYTPVKGVDYFTQEDINEIVQNILNSNLFKNLKNDVDNIKSDLEGNTILVSKKKGES